MKEKQFNFCPVCGSKNVSWLLGGSTGDQYRCSNCGYQGIVLKGTEQFIKKFKEKLIKGENGKAD